MDQIGEQIKDFLIINRFQTNIHRAILFESTGIDMDILYKSTFERNINEADSAEWNENI